MESAKKGLKISWTWLFYASFANRVSLFDEFSNAIEFKTSSNQIGK